MQNFVNITHRTPQQIDKNRIKLKQVYDRLPATKGCMENINAEGGCGAWCCQVNSPQVLEVEFANTWKWVNDTLTRDETIALIARALRTFLNNDLNKGCIFFDHDNKLCLQHGTRPFACFAPETLVMTSCGAVPISAIAAGDYVYGHDGKLHRVIHTMSREYVGPLYEIVQQGSGVRVRCTPEHLWWSAAQRYKRQAIVPRWVRADSLVEKRKDVIGSYLTFPRVWTAGTSSIKTIDLVSYNLGEHVGDQILPWTSGKLFEGRQLQSMPATIVIDDEFLFMYGLYLAEGHATSQSAGFTMNVLDRPILDRVAAYLASLDIRYHFTEKRNTLILRVDSCIFARLMKLLSGDSAANKRISPDLFRILDASQLWKIFEAWDEGDGRQSAGSVVYSVITISKRLAIQMQQICLMNGLFPRVGLESRSDRGETSHCVILHESSFDGWAPKMGQGCKAMYDPEYVYYPCGDITTNDYHGPVYDIEVENAHSFVTSAGIVHNCRSYGIMPEEEWKPRYEALKVINTDVRPQCDLVSTVDGKPFTKLMSDVLWKEVVRIEASNGIPHHRINDKQGGTYRTYHDHILLNLYQPPILKELSKMRLNATQPEKEAFIKTVISKLFEQTSKLPKVEAASVSDSPPADAQPSAKSGAEDGTATTGQSENPPDAV
jgi:hypothetical protein